jgi:hypothetical protein
MHFLNRLFCSTNLKSANSLHPRGKPKKYILQGGIPKKFFAGGKAKMVYFAGK